jgi:hypothetical protein
MNLSINPWKQEIAKICDFRYHLDDRLDVVDGHLYLTQGTSRRMSDPVTNNAKALAEFLKVTKQYADDYFKNLKDFSNKKYPYYEEVVEFKHEVKALKICLGYLHHSLSAQQNSEVCNYDTLIQQVWKLCDEARKYKSDFKREFGKPPKEQRPVKYVIYTERTDVRNIDFNHPSRALPKETAKAAKDALGCHLKAKELIPDDIGRRLFNYLSPDVRHMRAFQTFAGQLLRTPFLSDEFIKAFITLAPHVEIIDLEDVVLGSKKATELAPYIDAKDGKIDVKEFLEKMQQICEERDISLHLTAVQAYYEKANFECDKLGSTLEAYFKLYANHFDPRGVYNRISPTGLHELLNAAVASPTCREIQLHRSITKYESFRKLLKDHSFELNPRSKKYEKKKVPETSSLPFYLRFFSWK